MGPQHIGTMAHLNLISTQHPEGHQISRLNSARYRCRYVATRPMMTVYAGHIQLWYDNYGSTKNIGHYVCTMVSLQTLQCAQLDQTLEQKCDD
jgi:hypothetical protein